MFCPKCGAQLKDGAKFCTACGTPIAAPQPTPEPVQTPQPSPEPVQAPQPSPEPVQAPQPDPEPVVQAPQPTPEPVVQAPQPTPEPVQAPQPTPAQVQTPQPTPAQVHTATSVAPFYPMPAKRISGGLIALIVVGAVLMLTAAIVAITLLFGNPFSHSSDDDASLSMAPTTDAPIADAPIDADDVPSFASGFDIATLDGVYYCAQETGSTLEMRANDGQLSIYKTHYGVTDVSTLIPAPSGPSFTIDYDNRLIEFNYSAAGRSVTVTEAGFSSLFTTDGDQSWIIDAQSTSDPFHDPNGYILPTDSRYISESELYAFDEEQVKLIRNEIYARHGYSFTMEKFRTYFNSKNWYFENPNVNVNTFGTDQMNSFERANVDTIKAYENKMGW